eukprot:CAMPEP_0175879092 /NCGR_PEP_ID=MMETSP0107_2-20121207/41569_1 /TAXON_ID=195067 ORGANISM="Goniomonas pacifica, Strain CCMP1869" /NCGR_SAMPLE_ID=MMETSP0107_2 /ASSEMBLY_ACC=CAM_ASM_000203 /LENGTH=51 /DNA_ID=CAMNT_0017198685 /DNA_START=732 /DNA_END=887 /DNA_ORIENTATION=+
MGADPPESSAGTSQFAAPPTVEPKAPESSRAGSRRNAEYEGVEVAGRVGNC